MQQVEVDNSFSFSCFEKSEKIVCVCVLEREAEKEVKTDRKRARRR